MALKELGFAGVVCIRVVSTTNVWLLVTF